MKKTRIMKIIIILILTMLVLGTNVNAMSEISNAINSANDFVSHGQSNQINYSAAYNVANLFYTLLVTIAIIIAIVKGLWIANKIIIGSVNERADSKKMIVDYIFLLVVLALVPAIVRLLINLIP